jgi:hypothetical protein
MVWKSRTTALPRLSSVGMGLSLRFQHTPPRSPHTPPTSSGLLQKHILGLTTILTFINSLGGAKGEERYLFIWGVVERCRHFFSFCWLSFPLSLLGYLGIRGGEAARDRNLVERALGYYSNLVVVPS